MSSFSFSSVLLVGLVSGISLDASAQSACATLAALPAATVESEGRFRLLSSLKSIQESKQTRVFGPKGMTTKTVATSRLTANIDMRASPLYQSALLQQVLPDRDAFMKILNDKAKSDSMAGIAKLLIDLGFLDLYDTRNTGIHDAVDAGFPGTFEDTAAGSNFVGSFPAALLSNADPNFAAIASQGRFGIGRLLAKSTPLFPKNTWTDLLHDVQQSLVSSTMAFRSPSSSVEERLCATVLLHRAFAQQYLLFGSTQVPVFENSLTKDSKIPAIGSLLTSPHSTEWRACSGAGAWTSQGHPLQLSPSDLENTTEFALSQSPLNPPTCTLARSEAFSKIAKTSSSTRVALKSANEMLSWLSTLGVYLSQLSPSKWPDSAPPLFGVFTDQASIQTSGAILPAEAYAVALGHLKLAFAQITKDILILVDLDGRPSDLASAKGIRFRSQIGQPDYPRSTDLANSLTLTEFAFDFGQTLAELETWYGQRRPSNEILDGLFGSKVTFEQLTQLKTGSTRNDLETLKLANSLLISKFLKRESTTGRLTCAATLDQENPSDVESTHGDCSTQDRGRLAKVMHKIAISYQAPLFERWAIELEN